MRFEPKRLWYSEVDALRTALEVEWLLDGVQRINEMNRQNRERQMKHQPNGMSNFPGQPRRFYMAGTARFLTRVREAEWLGGEHPYAYAMNNPVTFTDPSGNKPQKFFQSPQWFNWTPCFNPAEDDSLCRGRKPRPTTEWDDNFFWACAIFLTRNHIDRDASGGNSDKENHFIAGCLARIRCGDWCPNNVGSYMEAGDAIFGGTVSQADAHATDDGWDYADSYLNQLSGPFLHDDVKFCKHGARKSIWGTTKGKPKKR